MDIETIKIKRLTGTGNWDKYKTYKPAAGEMVYIDADHITNTLIIGPPFNDDTNRSVDLERIIEDDTASYILATGYMASSISQARINERMCKTGDASTKIVSDDQTLAHATSGKAPTLARSDHTHMIERSTIEASLETNMNPTSSFNCRRIMAGTEDPSKLAAGSFGPGDIYIKYE